MTTFTAFPREMWIESAAEAIGTDIGILINVSRVLGGAIVWVLANLLLALLALPGFLLKVLKFAAKCWVYANATRGQRRQMQQRWHRKHTEVTRVNARTYAADQRRARA